MGEISEWIKQIELPTYYLHLPGCGCSVSEAERLIVNDGRE